jgi:hypothetical protein
VPEQIARLGAHVDHVLHEGASQVQGDGLGELGLADPRLAAHQQRPACRQGGMDGVDLAPIEDVDLLRGLRRSRQRQ